jgi:LacI family transcriptional regulator
MTASGIKEVAQRAGVSVGTVSNVLNRPELVAPTTRKRVHRVIRELNFVRNESARQLRAGRSRTIGLIVLDVGNPFFTDVARGVEAAAEEAGLALMLASSDDQPAKEARYLSLFEEQRVQGVLITPVDITDARLAAIRRRGTPIVLVDQTSSSRGQCSVGVNDELGGRLAVEHLLAQGHKRLAFVGGPVTLHQVRNRLAGAQAAVDAAGKASLIELPTPALNVAGGRAAASELAGLPRTRRPTAVFCANDLLALGVLQEMTSRSVRVPDDLAIVGYDDIEFAGAAAVPLSSVRQPREQLGRAAAELLIEESSGQPHKHRHLVFDPELVVRRSSAPG